MKKKFFVILSLLLLFSIIRIQYFSKRCKDMNYAIERYTTTGWFNEHELYTLQNYTVVFSDGNMAVVEVTGLAQDPPHGTVQYKLYLEKNEKGVWKAKKYYPHP